MNHDVSIESSAAKARAAYVFCVALFPLVLSGVITLAVFVSGAVARDDGIGVTTKFAEFSHPAVGELIADQFEIRGKIKSVPSGKTVYLVEQSEGRYWPKKHLGDSITTFKRKQSTSAGAGYKYTIELVAVGDKGQSQIEAWFENGQKTGKYPGITEITEASILAKYRVVRQ